MSANEVVNLQINAIGNFGNVIGEVNKLRSQLSSLKLPENTTKGLAKGLDEVEAKYNKFQSLAQKGIQTKGDFNALVRSAKAAEQAVENLKKKTEKIGDKDIKLAVANSAELKTAEESLKRIIKLNDHLKSFGTVKGQGMFGTEQVANMEKLASSSKGLEKRFTAVSNAFKTGDIKAADAALTQLISHAEKYEKVYSENEKAKGKWTSVKEWATGAQSQLNKEIAEVKKAEQEYEKLRVEKEKALSQEVSGVKKGASNIGYSMQQEIAGITQAATKTQQLNDQIGVLRNQANYFFGLQNVGRLISRGFREAAESVRDLDKAMTETAVVTEYSVQDMWNKLPKYTKLANELGATTQGAYETMTLYYQQGLNTQEAFAVGTETMKMARIAGLDYAQTTNMMTAALRGFNMEINEVSAQRVNDVYSKLAAVTASDTRELGLAMERTASIAHSANMDFGNTTAFLAQMIETTREAPENLGTAMKTIIARFQELKENPYKISEVDGEEVDFNRVDKALKSIGVDLMDNKDKFRDLDDVFMDISEKWDGLSQTQQRYIATIAAGARQQSRFLAMVGNYDRLKQLTDAAANSEGAAQVQFNKTLDSYEAKMNKLKNAWQAYTMSLANNKVVKGVVDFLQKIISLGNDIIDKFGEIGKTFGSWGEAFGQMIAAFGLGAMGFKGLRFGAEKGLGALGKLSAGAAAKEQRKGYFTGGIGTAADKTMAAQISNPIVNAINRLGTLLTGKEFGDQGIKDRSNLLKSRRNNLYDMMVKKPSEYEKRKGVKNTPLEFSAYDVNRQLSGLTKDEQQALYRSMPSLASALKKNYTKAFDSYNFSDQAKKDLDKYNKGLHQQVESGQISFEEALRRAYNPAMAGQSIGGETGKEINRAIFSQMRVGRPQIEEEGKKQAKRLKSGKQVVKGKINAETGEKTPARVYKATGEDIRGKMAAGQAAAAAKKSEQDRINQITKTQAAVTSFSNATSSAGQAVMGLGMAMSAAGFGAFGSIITSIGSGIMGLGMAAEGAVAGISSLNAALAGVGLSLGPIAAVAAGVAAIGVAIAYTKHKEAKAIENTQKEARKVTSDYDKAVEKTTKNLNTLNDAKADFEKLSKGVDSNGNNIDLGTEEYSDYLKIVNEVAKMHPELVKGYNAHGQAILKNNKAVEDAIKAENDARDAAEKAYASEESLDKLIAGRNTTKRWQVGQEQTRTVNRGHGAVQHRVEKSQLEQDSQAVIDSIKKLENGQELLSQLEKDFHLEPKALTNLTDEGIKAIQEHGSAMVDQVKEQYGDADDELTIELVKGVQNSIAKVGKDTEGINEVVEPIYKSLSTYASREHLFDNIPDEFREAAEAGLKEVAKLSVDPETGKEVTGTYMQKRAQEIGQEIADLNGHADDYRSTLETLEDAQKQYSKSLDETEYFKGISDELSTLAQWRDEALKIYESEGDESQKLIAESLQNQIEAYENFTSEGIKTLADGFNEQAEVLERASGAAENFQKKTEGINDYYTGADNMKAIIDDIKDGVDDVGKGSRTFWAGAEELLGEEFIKNNSFDKVNKQVGKLKDMFYDANGEALEAQESADKFMSYLQDNQNKNIVGDLANQYKKVSDLLNVTENGFDFEAARGLDADQFADLAQSLGVSDQLLASMLNKAAQFYNIDFSNADVLREALATGEGSIGTDVVDKKSGNNLLYTRRSAFEAEAAAEGYTPPEFKKLEEQLKDKGVKLLADAGEMSTKQLTGAVKNMGMDSAKEFISGFSELGYGRDEIKTLYDKALAEGINDDKLGLKEGQTFNDLYSEFLRDRADETFNEDKSAEEATADNTGESAALLGSINAAVGGLDVGDKGTSEDGKEGKGYEALNKVLGDKGMDTKAQYFSQGLNKKTGQELNETQYMNTLNSLSKQKQNYENEYAKAMVAAQNTSDADLKLGYERQAGYYQEAAAKLGEYIQMGEEAHKKKLEQDAKENESDEKKKQSKEQAAEEEKNADKDTANTAKQTEEEKAQAKQKRLAEIKQELEDLATAEGDNAEQAKQKALEEAEALGMPKEQLEELKNKATTFNAAGGVFGNLTNDQGIALMKSGFQGVLNDVQLTDQQLAKLGNTMGNLSPEKIQNLTNADFGNLLSNLDLTEDQIKNLEKTHPEIAFQADTKEIDKAGEKADEPTKKKKEIKYEAKVEKTEEVKQTTEKKVKDDLNKGKEAAGQQTEKINKNLEVTYTPIIANEGEIQATLQSRVNSIVKNASSKKELSVNAKVNVAYTKTKQAKASNQNATVNYKKGAQEKAEKQTAIVNYKRGSQEGPSSPKSATVNYSLGSQAEPKDKHAKVIYDKAEKGKNNYIRHQAPIMANSLAIGNVKKQKQTAANLTGGLTLTGEKGFEIAWLPSQNRSMILGAEGPQMVNLPKDAVVWTNEQSKKIMKQKAIPASSAVGGKGNWGGIEVRQDWGNSNDKGGRKAGGKGSGSQGEAKKKWKWVNKTGNISTYIYNIEKKIEQVQRKQATLLKAINKELTKASVTMQSIKKASDDEIKTIKENINLNQKLVNNYNKKLKDLNSKGTTKIEWEQTKKKGKKKKKEKRKQNINLGDYIYYNEETGAYQIDDDKINRSFKDKNKKKAVQEEAQKKIDEYTSKRDSAQDAINTAQDNLDELGQKLYETFYDWKNELTEIFNITKKIEDLENHIERSKQAQSLADAMIASGAIDVTTDESNSFVKKINQLFKSELETMVAELAQQSKSIIEHKKKLDDLKNNINLEKTLTTTNSLINRSSKATKLIQAEATKKAADDKVAKDAEAIRKKNSLLQKTTKKKEEAKAKKAEAKIKKDNKTIKSKKASKKQKNKAKNDLKAQKAKKSEANKNIKAINAGITASKNVKKDKDAAAAALKRLNALRQEAKSLGITNADILSETQLLVLTERKKALEEQEKIANKAKEFTKITTNKDGTVNIDFNSEALEEQYNKGDISKTMYEGIKEYVEELQDTNNNLQDLYKSQMQVLEELYTTSKDLKEQYADYSEDLLEIIEDDSEKQVDSLQKLNDSLVNALKDLLDEVKKQLETRRQEEDNRSKEEEIRDKQRRLAALKADTSGGKASEIKQLEKEIAEAQRSYGRELEDQELQKLQDQADKAAKQRERQIELLSEQVEIDKTNGTNLNLVKELLAKTQSDDAKEREDAKLQIWELWKANKNYEDSTEQRKAVLANEFNTFWAAIQKDGLPAKIEGIEQVISETNEASLATLEASRYETPLSLKGEEFLSNILLGKNWTLDEAGKLNVSLKKIIEFLKDNKKTNEDIKKIFENNGVEAKNFKELGLSASEAKEIGYSAKDLYDAKYTAKDLKEGGFEVNQLKEAGIKDEEILDAGYGVDKLREAGYGIKELGNFNSQQLKAGGFTVEDFKAAEIDYNTIKDNFTAEQLYIGGYEEAREQYLKDKAAAEKVATPKTTTTATTKTTTNTAMTAYNNALAAAEKNKKTSYEEIKKVIAAGKAAGVKEGTVLKNLAGTALTWKQILTALKGNYNKYRLAYSFDSSAFQKAYNDVYGKDAYKKNREEAKKRKVAKYAFASGGLANYTGPAWLDGTPAKPELVLNAQDTKNFLALKDVLSKVMGSTQSITNTYGGNNNYEININVDHINNDYDVDKIAERVKKNIVKDASYRNVTQVRNFR